MSLSEKAGLHQSGSHDPQKMVALVTGQSADLLYPIKERLDIDTGELHKVSDRQAPTFHRCDFPSAPLWRRQVHSMNEMIKQNFCGTVWIRTAQKILYPVSEDNVTKGIVESPSESHTSVTIRPAQWLSMLGMKRGVHFSFTRSTIHGWKHTISPFRVVPDDALIFEFCKLGNLSAVQQLLSGGDASARDTDSRGFTPLHVSLISS